MLVDKVNQYLSTQRIGVSESILAHVAKSAALSFKRQFGEDAEERKGGIRLSSIGQCLRKQAYKVIGEEENGKEIDSRARMVFFQGDMAELGIVHLAKLAGCKITACGTEQITVELDGIKGHPDGILFDNGQVYLLEVKSMSSYGFKDFEAGNLDEGYRWQINAYLAALGLGKCVVVAMNKDAGVLGETVVVRDEEIVKDIRSRIGVLKALEVTEETNQEEALPERFCKPDAKGFYPWQATYCPFWMTCLPNAEKVLVLGKYKTKEKAAVAAGGSK